jgi:glycosyltransferase involved in cell wall biosynthesis
MWSSTWRPGVCRRLPTDEAQVASAILRVLHDRNLQERLKRRAWLHAWHAYRWENVVQGVEHLYTSLADLRARSLDWKGSAR